MKLRIRSFRCRRIALLITIVIIVLITTRLLNLLFEEPVDKLLSIDAKQPPVINPQLKHPESDQELRQIQPPVPIPPDDDYDVKNVPKQPVISFPISENSSPFEAFKEGTLISKEETQGGLPVNKTIVLMRDKVREMMKFAWNGYATYAWGSNELRPVSKTGHLPSVLGTEPLGASLVDGLDTCI
uniref:alpha-1,2-Mannosidase n=1 Tax=Schistosoma japonicum TaxID=6182 RepID=Q5DDX6_SCHJA|nr:SJCHGC03680 protein [Schistosoma japonicum]